MLSSIQEKIAYSNYLEGNREPTKRQEGSAKVAWVFENSSQGKLLK